MEPYKISLAAARVNAEMTQEDVAKALHVSKQTIVRWENGVNPPDAIQFSELCELYGAPMNAISLHRN